MQKQSAIVLLSVLVSAVLLRADRAITPKYTIRSQGFNSVRRVPGQAYNHKYLQDMGDRENWYGTLSLTPEYTRSFRPGDIADCLFGDALVYGFELDQFEEEDEPPEIFAAVPLSASQSKAEIHGGTNFGKNGVIQATAILQAKQNPNIDNSVLAFSDVLQEDDPQPLHVNFVQNTDLTTNPQINSSFNPIFIKQSDINFARTKMITHKLFTHFQYTWDENETWIPYVGWGTEVEFAQRRDRCCDDSDDCDSCIRCGLSQWGIFAKVGVSYR